MTTQPQAKPGRPPTSGLRRIQGEIMTEPEETAADEAAVEASAETAEAEAGDDAQSASDE